MSLDLRVKSFFYRDAALSLYNSNTISKGDESGSSQVSASCVSYLSTKCNKDSKCNK